MTPERIVAAVAVVCLVAAEVIGIAGIEGPLKEVAVESLDGCRF